MPNTQPGAASTNPKKYHSCTETAALVRKALKESFPEIRFSVRARRYAGGGSINVAWTDGPNRAQVEAVARVFSGSYFDGMTDSKGYTYALVDGVQTHFAADHVFCERTTSDAALQRAIDQVYRQYEGNFEHKGVAKPTVEQYRSGQLAMVDVMTGGWHHHWTVQAMVSRAATKASDRMAVAKSKTAGKVIRLGSMDGNECGAVRVAEVA